MACSTVKSPIRKEPFVLWPRWQVSRLLRSSPSFQSEERTILYQRLSSIVHLPHSKIGVAATGARTCIEYALASQAMSDTVLAGGI